MKFGAILPNVGPLARIDVLSDLAVRLEAMGFDGVFLSDHIALPTELQSVYPYRTDGRFPLSADSAILEPITTLAYLAAVTNRIDLGFSVLVLPYRHPTLNAKMLGTLDVISNGRLIVGAGVGWMAEEFAALGSEFSARGTVTDEHIAILKAFWTEPVPDVQGTHYSVAGLGMAPQPVSQPHPPIWTGGISPPALRRAANLADGWHGVRQSPADVARVAGRIGELRASRGESIEGFTISLRAGLDVTDEPFAGAGRTPLRGSPAQVADDLAEYEQAGLDYLVVEPRAASAEQMMDQLERFTEVERP
jgi:probable F420-dependent oxidoreductase